MMDNITTNDRSVANSLGIIKRISWGAVFAGTLLALVIQLILSLLGLGIGLSTIDPLTESQPLAGLGIGSVIWWVVSMLIALFAGGWMAARLAGIPKRTDSIIHGVLTWSLFTLLSFYLLTTAVGRVISGVGGVVTKTVSTVGSGLASVAPEASQAVKNQLKKNNIDVSNLKEEAVQILQQTGKGDLQPGALKNQAQKATENLKNTAGDMASNPQDAKETASAAIDRLFSKGGDVVDDVDKEAAVNVIVQRTGKSRAEAEQMVNGWVATYQQGKAQVKQATAQAKASAIKAADATAEAVSKAAIYAFIGLVLGAIAAGVGGGVGRPNPVVLGSETDHYVSNRRTVPVH